MVTKNLDNDDQDDVVIKRDPEIVKREEAELAKKKTAELAQQKQAVGGGFTLEETAWLVVFVLVILAPMVLPGNFLNDTQVALFIVAPVMGWWISIIYKDEKRSRKIK